MPKQDFLPDADADLLTWLENFKTQVAALAATFGLSAAETTAVTDDFTLLDGKIQNLAAKKAAQQAATAEKRTARAAVEGRTRALARRLKAHPAFTAALGEQLGIVGPEDTTDLSAAAPTLRADSVQSGSVRLGFDKSVSEGVRILARRGGEPAFTLLAVDTQSPYVDTRANLAAGPETRQYQAQYLLNDEPVGNLSAVLVVTAPG